MKEGVRGLSMWDFLGRQGGLKQDCYQEFSSASDLVLRMLEAGREQSGVRLSAGTQVGLGDGSARSRKQASHGAQKYGQGLPGQEREGEQRESTGHRSRIWGHRRMQLGRA